jgi:hypothetical protein
MGRLSVRRVAAPTFGDARGDLLEDGDLRVVAVADLARMQQDERLLGGKPSQAPRWQA